MSDLLRPRSVTPGTPANQANPPAPRPSQTMASPTFAQVLQGVRAVDRTAQRAAPVTLSSHAAERLRERGIPVTREMLSRLTEATDTLAKKQARESLVVLSNIGFVVNVQNRTVVTAMPLHANGSHVFTNIDSAVWMQS